MLKAKPGYFIRDLASDSDRLDDDLQPDGATLIAPHWSTRQLKTRDGCHLRRYQRRRLVEIVLGLAPMETAVADSLGM
ncbi:MAG TPA: hypothetical protein VNK46_16935 [Nitrospiraceae bacterium]|jgi:hypothetical protein|nr:hypothetical protein [Nitrospiraceae bacterium]